jgi:hypothetical protein
VHPRLGTRWVVVVASVAVLGACGRQTFNLPLDTPPNDASPVEDVAAPPDGSVDPIDAADELGGNEGGSVGPEGGDEPGVDGADLRCAPCAAYGTVVEIAPLPSKLPECSGIAASQHHPGIFYAHNDSGDTARFFALSSQAELVAELDLRGATATDWEDIAVGSCPSGSCVYIGDIGDNNMARSEYSIFRVAEPDDLPAGGATDVAYERFPFVYPDGSHNAETLLVHPATGRIFVVTKVAGAQATVYELPLPLQAGVVATLVNVMPAPLPASAGLITAGDFHPCSQRLLLRTYSALYEMTSADGSPESIFAAAPVEVPSAVEPQGEAVAYGLDGRSYYMAGESPSQPRDKLSVVTCP